MRFLERKDFLCDPQVFGLQDTKTALRIYADYCVHHAPKPYPKFLEVDRRAGTIDPVWHTPIGAVQYERELEIPALNKFQKPDWRLTRIGIIANRQDQFIIAFNTLQELDYFPQRGDRVYWSGYRYMILNVVIPPEAYWQQTNQWMGVYVDCIVPPEGDSRPVIDFSTLRPGDQTVIREA